MEKDKRIIELVLVLVFVGMLFFASIIIVEYAKKETQQLLVYQNIQLPSSYVINSYNLYNNYEINYITVNPIRSIQIKSVSTKSIPTRIIHSTDWRERNHYNYEERDINYPNYREYSGQERRKEFLGNYVQEYYVYVLNKERTGRYFIVTFELKDKNGYEYSESITQYLRSGEKKKFAYRDIQFEINEIVDWDYEVIPEEY